MYMKAQIDNSVTVLADKISEKLVTKLGVPGAKSPFLGIIIGILPVLAELLGKNCAPSGSEGLRELANARGLRGRLFHWQYNVKLKQLIGEKEDYNDWGNTMGATILEVVTDEENSELVDAAMEAKPEPVWGVFTTGILILALLVVPFCGESKAQVFTTNNAGQLTDTDGHVVIPGSIQVLKSVSNNFTYTGADPTLTSNNCPNCVTTRAKAVYRTPRLLPYAVQTNYGLNYYRWPQSQPRTAYGDPGKRVYNGPTPVRSFMSNLCPQGLRYNSQSGG